MDFEKFYDKQPDYELFRNDPQSRKEYSVIADWKVRNLLKTLPAGFKAEDVLEVGCAFGYILNSLSDRLDINKRTGIDISGKNINAARSFYPDCRFFRGTLEEFIVTNPSKSDLTILSDIVEHIPDDLQFLVRVKSISSHILLNLPLEKSYVNRKRKYGEQDPSGHLRWYDEEDAVKLIRKSGLEIVKSFTSIAFFDKDYRDIYRKRRYTRLKKKNLLKKIFWSGYYFFQDRIKLSNKGLTRKFSGTNYFALLRNPLRTGSPAGYSTTQ